MCCQLLCCFGLFDLVCWFVLCIVCSVIWQDVVGYFNFFGCDFFIVLEVIFVWVGLVYGLVYFGLGQYFIEDGLQVCKYQCEIFFCVVQCGCKVEDVVVEGVEYQVMVISYLEDVIVQFQLGCKVGFGLFVGYQLQCVQQVMVVGIVYQWMIEEGVQVIGEDWFQMLVVFQQVVFFIELQDFQCYCCIDWMG